MARGDGYDRLAERSEGFFERQVGNFADRPLWTTFKWFVGIALVAGAFSVLGGVTGLLFDWGSETKRLVGPRHSREQVTRVLDLDEKMLAAAGNACQAQNAERDEGSPTLVEDPSFAYKALYRGMQAEYDRRMGNFFEAAVTKELPIPASIGHLPRRAPSVDERMAEVCG